MRLIIAILICLPGMLRAQCSAGDTLTANTVTNITTSSAILSGAFPVDDSITAFTLTYVREGQTDTVNTTAGGFSRTLSSLQSGTTYRYYWTTNCGPGVNIRQAGYYTFTTLGNTIVYTPMQALGYRFQYLRADSGFNVPLRDTSIYRGVNRAGAVLYKSGAGFFGYNGNYWEKVIPDSTIYSTKFMVDTMRTALYNRLESMWDTSGANIYFNTGSVAIGSATIDTSAALRVASTNKGFLPPKMTAVQAEAISGPSEGLLVYAIDGSGVVITTKGWWGYDGSTWVKLN